jgi:hypothetical protein
MKASAFKDIKSCLVWGSVSGSGFSFRFRVKNLGCLGCFEFR